MKCVNRYCRVFNARCGNQDCQRRESPRKWRAVEKLPCSRCGRMIPVDEMGLGQRCQMCINTLNRLESQYLSRLVEKNQNERD